MASSKRPGRKKSSSARGPGSAGGPRRTTAPGPRTTPRPAAAPEASAPPAPEQPSKEDLHASGHSGHSGHSGAQASRPTPTAAPVPAPPAGNRPRRLARTALIVAFAVVALVLGTSIVHGLRSRGEEPQAAPTSARTSSGSSPASPTVSDDPDNYEGAAGHVGPTSTSVPTAGTGTFTPLDAPARESAAKGRTVRYSLEVENGLNVDRALFVRTVHEVLLDDRGWQRQDSVRFVAVPAKEVAAGAPVDVRVTLAAPATVDRLCAPLKTNGKVSCANNGRAVLNLLRWETGAEAYGKDVGQYRVYLVNHEVGHVIGHGHVPCPTPGAPAPVMLQQTLSLRGCTANPWPTVTRG